MASFWKSRVLKYGSNAFTAVVMVLGILVVVNILSERYHRRFDMTQGKIYSLSDQTVTLLDSLKKDVHLVAFFREQDRPRFENLLKEYTYRSRHISYQFVDPDKNPAEARRYKIKRYDTTIIEVGPKEVRITGTQEKDLTNAIAKAIRNREKVVYFLTGHGEDDIHSLQRDGYNRVRQALLEANYVVHDSLLLARTGRVPDDCDLLIVAGPKTKLFPAEVDSIRSYLEGGGAGFFLLDPGVNTGLGAMLKEWQVIVGNNYVVDASGVGRLFGLDYSMPVAARYGRHPITSKHHGLMTFYMLARSVSKGKPEPGEQETQLVYTSRSSWAETDLKSMVNGKPRFNRGVDTPGPISLAVAVSDTPKRHFLRPGQRTERRTRLVVFGDSDFANNQFFGAQGNGDLFMNSVSWLLQEGDLISIRPKARGFRPISLTGRDATWLFWLSLVLLPGIPIVSGVAVWWKRH